MTNPEGQNWWDEVFPFALSGMPFGLILIITPIFLWLAPPDPQGVSTVATVAVEVQGEAQSVQSFSVLRRYLIHKEGEFADGLWNSDC